MMLHRKDFEKITILPLKCTKNSFIQCAKLVQGLKGSYIIQSPPAPQIQEIAFKIVEYCWIQCLHEKSSAAVPLPHSIS